MKTVRLNNHKIKAQRKELLYEAIFIDLVRIGALDRAVVEGLLEAKIPDYLIPTGEAVGTQSAE